MLIEVLYVLGCPNYEPALGRLRDLLRSEGVPETIREIAVTDEAMARSLRFPGSPTSRINGADTEPSEPLSGGLACRLYANGSGVPSQELLKRAILNAKRAEGRT